MKILKRILTIILIVVVLAMAGGMIFLNSVKTRALPDYNRDVDLEGLEAPVTVFRDSMGIPHIYAENEADLYRTVGYVMAQDRMWQMDLLRRITTGRLSEVLDPGLVEADQLFRARGAVHARFEHLGHTTLCEQLEQLVAAKLCRLR